MADEELLKIRKEAKKRKPNFVVKESHYSARVKSRWRIARGKHSGVRQFHKGKARMPNPGYGSNKVVKGLHPSGLSPILVHKISDLDNLKAEKQGVIIASGVGKRKKLELLKLAQGKKLVVLSVKDLATSIKDIEAKFEVRKKAREDKVKAKGKKEDEKKKKALEKEKKDKEEAEKEDKESVEDKIQNEEDSKKKEAKLAEKTITKKQ